MNRRSFIKRTAAAGASLLSPRLGSIPDRAQAATPPNILFILVDQLRDPQWFPDQPSLDRALPAMARIRSGAVSFRQHHVAATASVASRGALITGLYSHQTGCLVTIDTRERPDLATGFPTWGTLLRGFGYQTFWWGKWHVSQSCDIEQFGFSGGTCPSPNGFPNQGLTRDPFIVDQFLTWLQGQGTSGPWATTVSLVNPHDIGWYYSFSEHPAYAEVNSTFATLPPNFETRADLVVRKKPRIQIGNQAAINQLLGVLPDSGANFEANWRHFLDLYLHIQRQLDTQIGRVLDALAASPFASNTIIVFTSDHGDYCGSHGLRGKAYTNYDEAIRVPFYVKDPTGRFTTQPDRERMQLTSHVDVVPLLLTLATGGNDWRARPECQHLAKRHDMAAILADPEAPGRTYILHTSDEELWDRLTVPAGFEGTPYHVIGYRNATAKLGVYSSWLPGTIAIESTGQEFECYDYGTLEGRLELDNVAETNLALTEQLRSSLVNDALPNELREPLPNYLLAAQQQGITNYLTWRRLTRSVLSPNRSSVMLGYGPLNIGGPPETIILTNESAAPITVQSISFDGTHPRDFTRISNAGASIQPGGNFTVATSFYPTGVGVRSAVMIVRHTGAGSPLYIGLRGVSTHNLLSNPGFELDADRNWSPDIWTANTRVTRSQTLVRSGSYAMKHAASDNASYGILQKVNTLQTGAIYRVGTWVNIPSANQGFAFTVSVSWFAGDNRLLATNVVRSFTGPTFGWEQAVASLVAPGQTAYANIVFSTKNLNTTLYVDDCFFQTENMVVNGGFEWDSDRNGAPDFWSTHSQVTRDNTLVRSGQYAMKHVASVNANYSVAQKVNGVTPATSYIITAWVNIPVASSAFAFQVTVQWYTVDQTVLATNVVKRYTGATLDWDLAYATCTAPAGAAYALVIMSLSGVTPGIYVDDVAMRP